MFFLRRLIGRLLFVTALGFVIRKLRESDNGRARRIGEGANKALGGPFGAANGKVARPRRRIFRSAGSAAVGGAMSYFFDPDRGRGRRDRVKGYAKQRLARARHEPALLGERGTPATAPATGAQSRSNIV